MSSPSLFGVPYKVVALVTLVVQNSALTILLHYSRISVEPSKMYSAASAVLLNELLKGAISFAIAFSNAVKAAPASYGYAPLEDEKETGRKAVQEGFWAVYEWGRIRRGASKMRSDVFSSDCWKLSIPACLYVVQNNLQFVAASNLSVPTFQVSYNLKILTTALFSVLLLNRKLSTKKWTGLFFLAAGVAIVQIQSSTKKDGGGSHHEMNQAKGLLAVGAACMTSGLAGVYFEKVLKGSKTDLWIRNCQLSFFSMLPALTPVFLPNLSPFTSPSHSTIPTIPSAGVFAHFGFWAWAVVLTQVVGGLVTALVIKYSDNILKGFATSLAIVLSFIAGIILFDFQVTTSFVLGTLIVIGSTYLFTSADSSPSRGPILSSRPSSISISPPSNGSRHQAHSSIDYSAPLSPSSSQFESSPALNHQRFYQNGAPSPPMFRRNGNSHIGTSGPLMENGISGLGISEQSGGSGPGSAHDSGSEGQFLDSRFVAKSENDGARRREEEAAKS